MVVKLNILEDEPMEELKQTKNARNKVKTAIYFTAVSVCVVGSICILACWQKIQSPGDYIFSDIGELDNGNEGVNGVHSKIGDTSNISISISNAELVVSDMNLGDYDHSEHIEPSTNEPVDQKLDSSTDERSTETILNTEGTNELDASTDESSTETILNTEGTNELDASTDESSTETNRNTEVLRSSPKYLILEAISKDDANETKVLIEKFYQNFDGNKEFTPLTAAAYECNFNIAKMLIENGANVNIVDQYGWRPIHVATSQDCEKIVEMLIKHGADKNAKDIGFTALHIAAQEGHDRIAQLLVNNEADVQIRDSSNSRKTALEWAKTKEYENVIKILTAHLASLNDPRTTEPTSYESAEDLNESKSTEDSDSEPDESSEEENLWQGIVPL